ncbi:DUF6950 family protein [Leclercia adecarboxylata]|uniref:DUF6950 family protein n=1 Tax=Leclercia adecarboxylata TaxID=83655 RepID=UPI0021F0D154|nr:hypothetical protein [Leclercia adecarboxylata]UYM56776.1 hypothetical protein N5937_05600 [Leclercia adecarboxylata]
MRNNIIKIHNIAQECISTEFQLGQNDCNILVLKVIDQVCGTSYTDLAFGKYKTIKAGLKLFTKHELGSLEEICKQHGVQVDTPVFGDIMVNGIHGSVVLDGKYIALNNDSTGFNVAVLPWIHNWKFYRITPAEGGE